MPAPSMSSVIQDCWQQSTSSTATTFAATLAVAVLAATAFFLTLVKLWEWKTRRNTNNMPGPGFFWLYSHLTDYHDASVKLAAKYGGIYNVFLGNRNMAVISDPALLKQVLQDHESFPKIPAKEIFTSKRLVDFLGTSFLGLNGKAWMKVKRNFATAFHMLNLKPLIPLFYRRTTRVLRCLIPPEALEAHRRRVEACATVGTVPPKFEFEVDMKKWMARLSLDILGQTMLGCDLGALPDPSKRVHAAKKAKLPHTCHTATGFDSEMMEAYVLWQVTVAPPPWRLQVFCDIDSGYAYLRYECFFDAFGDVRTISLPNYDAWPFINKHGKCLPHSLSVLNQLILDMIAAHEAELDKLDARAANTPPRHDMPIVPPPPFPESRASQASVEATAPQGTPPVNESHEEKLAVDTHNGRYGKTHLLHCMLSAIRNAAKTGAEEPLSREDLRANLVMFFIAGHDTTSTAMSWCVHYLANHQDVQDRLREEVLRHGPWSRGEEARHGGWLSEEASPPCYEDLSPARMPYLDAIVKEVMRLRPPVGNVWTRKAAKDTEVGGYIIKKGSMVSPSIYNVHHDPSIWPDPYAFKPERFMKRDRSRHPYSYVPFLMGSRMCLGSNFSQMEQRVFLAQLVRHFIVRPPKSKPTTCDGPTANVAFHNPDRVTVILEARAV